MSPQKFKRKLLIILAILVFLVSVIFLYMLPDTTHYQLSREPAFINHYKIIILWIRLIALPLFYCIYRLYKVVNRVGEGNYFDPLNVLDIKLVSRVLKLEMLACVIAFIFILAPLPVGPGVVVACIMLLMLGYLVATFFDFLAITMQQGHIIKLDQDLTI